MQINESNVMQAIQDPKNWKRTRKKSYEVYMCMPEVGTQCSNFLEGSNYVTDQNKRFILSGTVGETWVIDANKLAKTYTFEDGTPITPETLKNKSNSSGLIPWTKLKTKSDATTNWAVLIPKDIQNFPVQTSWGDVLYANRPEVKHGYGDFLLCQDDGSGNPNLNDVWVVNGAVFPTTYDLRAFRGLFDEKKVQASTPVPKHKFVKEKKGINKFQALIKLLYNYAMKAKPTYGFDKIEIGPEKNASKWTDDTKPERWALFISSAKDPDKSIVMHTLATDDRVVIESFNNKNPKNSDVCFSCGDPKEVKTMFMHIKDFFTNDACESIGAAKIDTSHKDKAAIQQIYEYADSNRLIYRFNKVNMKFTECCYKKRWRILIKSEYGPTKWVTIHRDSESDTDTAVVLSYESESFMDGQYFFRYSNDVEVAQAFLVISLFLRNEKFNKIEDAAKLVESGQKDILQLYDYIIKNKRKYGFKQVEISSAPAYDEDLIIDISNDDKEVRISIEKNSSLARIRSITNTYFDYKSQKELDDVLDRLHRFFKDSKARDLNDIENKGNKSKEVMNKLYSYANEGKEKYGFNSVELRADETIPNKWLVVIASNDAQNKIAVISRLDVNRAMLETFNTDNDLTASISFAYSDSKALQSTFNKLSNFFKNPAANTILDV